MRSFIALELPDAFRFELAGLARRLEAAIDGRFVMPDNYHVTLAFLGDVDEAALQQAMTALDVACDGVDGLELRCNGLGKFGKSRDATLWLGLQATEQLEELAVRVRAELADRGVPFDGKAFKAHVTIARRAKIPAGQLPMLPFPAPCMASAVTLFKSELRPEGAFYAPLYSVDVR